MLTPSSCRSQLRKHFNTPEYSMISIRCAVIDSFTETNPGEDVHVASEASGGQVFIHAVRRCSSHLEFRPCALHAGAGVLPSASFLHNLPHTFKVFALGRFERLHHDLRLGEEGVVEILRAWKSSRGRATRLVWF